MDPFARDVLKRLTANFGEDLWRDPEKCGALLGQFCDAFPRERDALIAALRTGIVEDLVAWRDRLPAVPLAARLSGRLASASGLSAEDAFWAVESWGQALGVFAPDGGLWPEVAKALRPPPPSVAVLPRTQTASLPRLSVGLRLLGALAGLAFMGLAGVVFLNVFTPSVTKKKGVAAPAVDAWDPKTARFEFVQTGAFSTGDPSRVARLRFMREGRALAVWGERGVRLWDWTDGTAVPLGFLEDAQGWVCDLSEDLTLAAAVQDGRSVLLWVASGERYLTLQVPVNARATFTADGRRLLLPEGGRLTSLELYDGTSTGTLTRSDAAPVRMVLNRAGSEAALYDATGTVLVVQTENLASRQKIVVANRAVSAVAYSPEETVLACAAGDGWIHLWDLAGEEETRRISCGGPALTDLHYMRGGDVLVGLDEQGTLRVWDLADGAEAGRQKFGSPVCPVFAPHPDGETLALGRHGGRVTLLELRPLPKTSP